MSTTPAVDARPKRQCETPSQNAAPLGYRIFPMKRSLPSFVTARHMSAQVARLLIALFLISSIVGARAVVFPTTSMPSAYEKYTLRVMNERAVPTLRVEIHFPEGLRVVSFGDVPNWNIQILTDTTNRITGAV